ncbi:MAG: hypothetical protein HGA80_03610 [Candidatus Omnitrophica bacterium]|nr:hypothetical protein [Candidatus Omnitrophota bacterium]
MRHTTNSFGGLAVALLSATLVLASSGCVYLAVGALGVVGGYVVSPDTVEGTINFSLGETWDASKEIVRIMGTVVEENEAIGQLVATVNGTRVTVSILTINSSSSKLSVKARKSFMPKIDVAQDVYTKIVNSMGK